MEPVVSIVRGAIAEDRRADLVRAYEGGLDDLPPVIIRTYLLRSDDELAIVTVWRSRAALDAMIATGAEPFARRLIREAGGEPRAEFLSVLAASDA